MWGNLGRMGLLMYMSSQSSKRTVQTSLLSLCPGLSHSSLLKSSILGHWPSYCFFQAVQFVNEQLLKRNPGDKELFDVIVLSNNSPESGVRIINSAKQHGRLPIHKTFLQSALILKLTAMCKVFCMETHKHTLHGALAGLPSMWTTTYIPVSCGDWGINSPVLTKSRHGNAAAPAQLPLYAAGDLGPPLPQGKSHVATWTCASLIAGPSPYRPKKADQTKEFSIQCIPPSQPNPPLPRADLPFLTPSAPFSTLPATCYKSLPALVGIWRFFLHGTSYFPREVLVRPHSLV